MRRELLSTSRFQNLKLYPQERGRLCLSVQDYARAGNMTEHGNPGSTGDHFLENLELFGTYFHNHQTQPGDVPTWSCEAFDEPRTNELALQSEDDGDRSRGSYGVLEYTD